METFGNNVLVMMTKTAIRAREHILDEVNLTNSHKSDIIKDEAYF